VDIAPNINRTFELNGPRHFMSRSRGNFGPADTMTWPESLSESLGESQSGGVVLKATQTLLARTVVQLRDKACAIL
jgi:hypothetical protein